MHWASFNRLHSTHHVVTTPMIFNPFRSTTPATICLHVCCSANAVTITLNKRQRWQWCIRAHGFRIGIHRFQSSRFSFVEYARACAHSFRPRLNPFIHSNSAISLVWTIHRRRSKKFERFAKWTEKVLQIKLKKRIVVFETEFWIRYMTANRPLGLYFCYLFYLSTAAAF